MIKYLVFILTITACLNLNAQNIGFESGNTDGWIYRVNGIIKTPINEYNSGLYVTKQSETVHKDIGQAAKFPDGGRHSLMIGTFDKGESNTRKVHSIEREIKIDDDIEIPLFYSLYFESHNGYFKISVFDSSNIYYNLHSLLRIPIAKFDVMTIINNTAGYFRKWTPNTIKLKNLKGKKVTLKIEVSGCSAGGHSSIMWIDFKCYNPQLKLNTFQCKDELTVQLKDNTFNQVLDINKNNLFDFAGEKTKINLQTHKPHYLVGFNDTSCAEEIPILTDVTYGLKAECNSQICLNDSLELNIQSSVYDKFTIDFAGELRQTQELKIKHKFKEFGINKITLISTDSFCSDTIIKSVNTLNNKHSLNFIEFGCIRDTFNIKENTTSADLKTEYKWLINPDKYITDYKTYLIPKFEDSLIISIFSEDNNFCKDTSTGKVYFYKKPNSEFFYKMSDIDEFQFQPLFINEKFIYSWSYKNDTLNHIYMKDIFEDKNFSVNLDVYGNGCYSRTTKWISNDTLYAFIPNAFYPKSSNFNPSINHTNEYEMNIYNRWGEMIFTTDDTKVGWDGKYKGIECQQDTYVYSINLKDYKGENHKYRGTITLLR